MATTTTATVTPAKNMKKKVWIFIVGSIVIILYYLYSSSSSSQGTQTTNGTSTTELIPIYTDKWTVVNINGKKSKWYPPIVSGELRNEIKYLVLLNDLKSIPKEMPRDSSLDLQGVKTLYFSLVSGQGITNAEIRIDLE